MSINSFITSEQCGNTAKKHINYIISHCSYAALSISTLLHGSYGNVVILNPENPTQLIDCFSQYGDVINKRITVFLPNDPRVVLDTLNSLSLLIKAYKAPINILLLSHLQPYWLYRTLQNIVPLRKLLSSVRAARPGTEKNQIFKLLNKNPDEFPLLEQLSRDNTRNNGPITEGLTRRELDVILNFLNGSSVSIQSTQQNVSIKTLYSQKITGLKKLSMQFPTLKALLPGTERKKIGLGKGQLNTSTEVELWNLSDAVRRGLFFQVYQPVIGRDMNIKGFEILSRWYQNGKELLPSEFLPQIRTVDSWVLLTACIINSAIDKINQFQGEYWFSINIPASLSGSPALLRMLNSARKKLSKPELQDKLILEFSDATDWSKNSRSVEVIRQLNEQNYSIFLDDFFSDKTVIFPVKKVSFGGYKLDISIVNNFMHNKNDRFLIEGLVYYCHLTGSKCIAKGVDTLDKFLKLKEIGVAAFQGYYFSRPVLGEELDIVITKWNKKQ